MDTREVLAAGQQDGRASLHLPALAVQSVLLLAAMAFGATLLGRRFRWYTYGTILTLLVCGGLAGTYASDIEADMPTPGAGLIERVNIYATMLWVAVLAVALLPTQGALAAREPITEAASAHGQASAVSNVSRPRWFNRPQTSKVFHSLLRRDLTAH
jgi:uncharacterized membrane protein